MKNLKSVALAALVGLAASSAQAADSLGSFGADERPVMLSYSVLFGSTKQAAAETFALSVADNMRASINTDFEMHSLMLNGMNVGQMSERLNADGDDGYVPLIAVVVVVGGAMLLANDDGDNAGGKKKKAQCDPQCGGGF